jgi:hypothetical protein
MGELSKFEGDICIGVIEDSELAGSTFVVRREGIGCGICELD